MTGPERDHAAFDELAAGYLLHALDEEDEQRFLRHAEDCPRCPEILAGFGGVVRALAETAPAAEPPPELGERIMAVVRAGLPGDAAQPGAGAAAGAAEAPPGRVIPLARRPVPRWLRPAAAAAAVLVIGGGIWAGLAATSSNPPAPSTCAHQHDCAQVPVLFPASHQQAARVVVLNGSVYLTPTRMAADHRTSQIYVLWQIPRGHAPLAVGSFDVRPGPNPALKIGTLVAPYGHTAGFAISLEQGRKIPPIPTKVVAVGLIT